MSGGSFDYAYERIEQFADDLQNRLDSGRRNDVYDYGEAVPCEWPVDVAVELRAIVSRARYVAALAKEVEWLYSADTGEETFMTRVMKINADFMAKA